MQRIRGLTCVSPAPTNLHFSLSKRQFPHTRDLAKTLGRLEPSKSLLQVRPIRQMVDPPRRLNAPAVEFLEPVSQHWPIVLLQNVRPQVNPVVRVDPKNSHILRTVVDPAERQPIRNLRISSLVSIR